MVPLNLQGMSTYFHLNPLHLWESLNGFIKLFVRLIVEYLLKEIQYIY